MHHLHDGPWPHSSPSQSAPLRRPRATLAALQWAAERAGQSYGRFTLKLTEGEQAAIQGEYERFLAARRRAQAAQAQTSQPRVDNSTVREGYEE